MTASTAWNTSEPTGDLANHVSSLSMDDYTTPARQNGVALHVSAAPYTNVHAPQRPSFAPYDPSTPYLYYANTLDPAYTTATANGHQFSLGELATPLSTPLGTPLQPMATGMTFDFATPESFVDHSTPERQGQAQGNLQPGSGFHTPSSAGTPSRSHGVYRPPHMQHQFPQSPLAGSGFIPLGGDRSYWREGGGGGGGGRRKSVPSAFGAPRRNGQHQQAATLGIDFPHSPYSLASPLQSGFQPGTSARPFSVHHFNPYSPNASHFFGRARRQQEEGVQLQRSPRLEEFRQRKASRMELSEVFGNIVEFAGDQHGSRFIQNKLEIATPEERAKVFDEIMPNAYQLMTDVFGNYVIQKLFEHGDQAQKAALAKKMEGHVHQLSTQMYGCRVMQKALEHVLVDQREKLISELNGRIIECVKSSNANHVIQRMIMLDPPASVIDAFVGHVYALSTHPFGCRVLQKAFEVLEPTKIRQLLDEMHCFSYKLMTDQFGNYVVQSVITDAPGREYDRDKAVGEIKTKIFELSRHKFASNVVERALKFSNRADRRELISELCGENVEGGENRIGTLLRDQYGNFPVQTALAEADDDQRDMLLSAIIPLMPNLRHTPCGRRLEAKIAQYEAKQMLPGQTSEQADVVSNSTQSDSPLLGSESNCTSVAVSVTSSDASPQLGPKCTALRRVVSSGDVDSVEESQALSVLLG